MRRVMETCQLQRPKRSKLNLNLHSQRNSSVNRHGGRGRGREGELANLVKSSSEWNECTARRGQFVIEYSHGQVIHMAQTCTLAWPAISSCIRIRIRIRTRMWIRYRNRNGTRNRRGLLRKFLMNELTFCWPVYGKVQYYLPSAYTQIKSTCSYLPPPLSYPLPCTRLWLIRYKSKVRLT